MYRLKGLNDRWMMTMENQPNVQFSNVSPGHYRLEVRVVDIYGEPMGGVETLDIIVRPPFYLSFWALLLYMLLIALGACGLYRRMLRRRREAKSVWRSRRSVKWRK